MVAAFGHEVIAREIDVEEVGSVTARERPDVALVGLSESSDHALGLIEKIVHEAACPVIASIHAPDPAFVREASKRGIFAYVTDSESKDWQSSIDIVLRRFAEYHDLEGAFGRRAITERAKGILMERHSVDDSAAFERLASIPARRTGTCRCRLRGRRRAPPAAEGPSRTVVGHMTDEPGTAPPTSGPRVLGWKLACPRIWQATLPAPNTWSGLHASLGSRHVPAQLTVGI